MVCKNCGQELPDNMTFCTNCGAAVDNSFAKQQNYNFQPQQTAQSQSFNRPEAAAYTQQPYNAAPQYGQAYYAQPQIQQINNAEEAVSVKEWIGVFFLSFIPIANFILLLVWAFGDETKKSKSNYAKAALLFSLIVMAVSIVVAIVVAVAVPIFVAASSY